MKKLFILSVLGLALFANESHALIGKFGSSAVKKYDGTVLNPEKVFINVKAGAAISEGNAVCLDLTSDTGATAVICPTTGLAPICIATEAIASGAFGKCQVYGLYDTATFDSTNSASVAGKRFYVSTNNAGYISARATEVATEVPLGYFYDVSSASEDVQVFINLL